MQDLPGDFTEAIQAHRAYLIVLAEVHLGRDLRHRIDASDVVQDTLVEAVRHRNLFDGQQTDGLSAWLRKVLIRRLAALGRHHRAELRDVGAEISLDAAVERSSMRLHAIAADDATPGRRAIESEQLLRLSNALLTLTEAERDVLVMRFVEGKSLRAIAADTQESPYHVARRLRLASANLRSALGGTSST